MRFAFVSASLALAAACSDRASSPEPPASSSREHPLAQDGTAARALTSTRDRVKVQLDLSAVRGALQLYRGEHNAWPNSLAELRVSGLNYPADISYDPATGIVTSQTYPSY